MDMQNLCCCCLFRPLEKDLRTPYVNLGVTETYSNMIEECFAIQMPLSNDDDSGICGVCVRRLRDACDFKLQVQQSQAELLAQLEQAKFLKVENPLDSLEFCDDIGATEECITYEVPVGSELFDEDGPSDDLFLAPCEDEVKPTPESADDELALAREQLAMSCSVRLERLRDHKGPHRCPGCLHTFDHEAILAAHMRDHGDHVETRQITVYTRNICNICHKSFPTKNDVAAHLRAYAPFSCLTKTFPCNVCGLKFNKKVALDLHKDSLHDRETCDICKVHFRSMYELYLHIRSHTGNKPFFCRICPKRFSYRIDLIQHRKKHAAQLRLKYFGRKVITQEVIGLNPSSPQ